MFQITHKAGEGMALFSKMFIGLTVSGLDQSNNNSWRLSMNHNEEFRKDIEKVEQIILDLSLYSMPFVVAFLVKVVVL